MITPKSHLLILSLLKIGKYFKLYGHYILLLRDFKSTWKLIYFIVHCYVSKKILHLFTLLFLCVTVFPFSFTLVKWLTYTKPGESVLSSASPQSSFLSTMGEGFRFQVHHWVLPPPGCPFKFALELLPVLFVPSSFSMTYSYFQIHTL